MAIDSHDRLGLWCTVKGLQGGQMESKSRQAGASTTKRALAWLLVAGLSLIAGCGTAPEPEAEPFDRRTLQPFATQETSFQLMSGADDTEEWENGYAKLNSGTLQLTFDTSSTGNQTVGFRFASVEVPQGAVIMDAWIQFTARKKNSEPTSLVIQGVASSNTSAFTTVRNSVSTLPLTTASVAWSPPAWNVTFERGPLQESPNLGEIVSEIVSRPDWVSGNAMSFVITGTGVRVVSAFEDGAERAATLYVLYDDCPSAPCNEPPEVDAGPNMSAVLPATIAPTASVVDDGAYTVTWTQVSGPGTLSFSPTNAVATSVAASATGSYIARITVDDGEYQRSDDVALSWTEEAGEINPVVGISQVNAFETGWDSANVPLPIPSIDPSSLAYLSPVGTLLITDSEIEEPNVAAAWAVAQGNMFESNLTGTALSRTWDLTTALMGNNIEPTGVVYCEFDGHLYMSNDQWPRTLYRYQWNDGALSLDQAFLVNPFITDPEDVSCDPTTGNIYVVSGTQHQILILRHQAGIGMQYVDLIDLVETAGTPTGIPSDAEGIVFDPDSRHFFVISRADRALYEYTEEGVWVQTFNIKPFTNPKIKKPSGIAIAPSSVDPNRQSFYIADRRVDNDSDPSERDGAIYEALIERSN